jgi:hypothetical protein
LWLTDITQHRSEGWGYCAVVMDVYARRVVGWSIAGHLRSELVVDALDMARWRRKPLAGNTIEYSDHGVLHLSICPATLTAFTVGFVFRYTATLKHWEEPEPWMPADVAAGEHERPRTTPATHRRGQRYHRGIQQLPAVTTLLDRGCYPVCVRVASTNRPGLSIVDRTYACPFRFGWSTTIDRSGMEK